MKRTVTSLVILSLGVLASVFVVGDMPNASARVPNAAAKQCSNASLQGTYGLCVGATILPAGTPRGVLARFTFDGQGSFSAALTINDHGTVTHVEDSGPYAVNGDCTGEIVTAPGGMGTVEIVLVDGGTEFYQLRTNPSNIVFVSQTPAKKQLADGETKGKG